LGSESHKTIPGLGKERLESLTDGIFGTVMTVLILSLSVPLILTSTPISSENSALLHSLRGLLPDVLSYVISFAILGAFWIRHHSMFSFVIRVDRFLLWLNIIFLLTIGFIPFSTALIGRYPLLQYSLIVYGSNLIATSVTSQVLWIYAIKNKLVSHDRFDEQAMARINKRMTLGPLAYFAAILISFFDPVLTLLIYVITLFFLIINTTTGFRHRNPPPDHQQSNIGGL
jgi:uncharacterized membrane protein